MDVQLHPGPMPGRTLAPPRDESWCEMRASWEERYVERLLRHRWPILTFVALVTVVAACFVPRLGFDSSIEVWLREGDPELAKYRAFLDRFHADEITVIGLFADDVFAPETLAAVDTITREAAHAPFVHRVHSLTNVDVATGGEGYVKIAPLVASLPANRDEVEALRARALGNDLLVGTLVAADGRATAVIVESTPEAEGFEEKGALVEALREIAGRHSQRMKVRLAGVPPLHDAMLSHALEDVRVVGPTAAVAIALCIFLVFRWLPAVVLAITVVSLSLVWLGGLMGSLGVRLDVVSIELPSVVLAVGMADSVHLLADYFRELAAGRGRETAVRRSLASLMVPCLFTSVTTAAGMLSLLASDLRPLRGYGWEAAVGVIAAFLLSVTLLPVLLSMIPPPAQRIVNRRRCGLVTRTFDWLAHPTPRRGLWIAAVACTLMAGSLLGLGRMQVGANTIEYLPPEDVVRIDTREIDDALGGSASVELIITAPGEGLKEPALLAGMERLERGLESYPTVTKVVSVVDRLQEMNRVFTGGGGGSILPDSRPLVAQFYLLLENDEDFETLVQDNYSVGRLTARVKFSDAHALAEEIPVIERAMAEEYDHAGMEIVTTGYVKLMGEIEAYMVEGQSRSLLVAFAAVVVMLGLLLRSTHLAFLAMIPNVVPILITLGWMALVSIPLDPGTVMIGGVAMGLVVDDTVHFLIPLRRRLQCGASFEEAVRDTVHRTGRPIAVTSVILSAGFLAMLLGSFSPNTHFGVVTAVVILLALIADLVMLPATVVWLRPKI